MERGMNRKYLTIYGILEEGAETKTKMNNKVTPVNEELGIQLRAQDL